MVKVFMFAIIGGLLVAGCNNAALDGNVPSGNTSGPTGSAGAPFGADQSEVATPNSFPSGDTTRSPVMGTDNGVIGVTHLPP